jgi:hypothetical protein
MTHVPRGGDVTPQEQPLTLGDRLEYLWWVGMLGALLGFMGGVLSGRIEALVVLPVVGFVGAVLLAVAPVVALGLLGFIIVLLARLV